VRYSESYTCPSCASSGSFCSGSPVPDLCGLAPAFRPVDLLRDEQRRFFAAPEDFLLQDRFTPRLQEADRFLVLLRAHRFLPATADRALRRTDVDLAHFFADFGRRDFLLQDRRVFFAFPHLDRRRLRLRDFGFPAHFRDFGFAHLRFLLGAHLDFLALDFLEHRGFLRLAAVLWPLLHPGMKRL